MLEEMTYKEVDGLFYPQIEMPDETTLAIGKDSEIWGSKSSFLRQYATKCGKLPPCPGGCFPRA